ncbi:MAG TPA: hypothetical protein VFM55_17880 [Micromonosporaceae bacterium]|nr:hypothetical protein [Micromonosporaceae bacterium]
MSARWVAGSVRSRALPNRRLGSAGARALAASPSVDDAVEALARSPYRRFVRVGDSLAAAQRGVADTLLWHLRVLAGWVPADGVRVLRLLAGWFEVSNVDGLAASLAAGAAAPRESPYQAPGERPYQLGRLATAWPRLAVATSAADLRLALARSPWGDPGGEGAGTVSLALRLAWADRVAAGVAPAEAWARGAVALLVARNVAGQPVPGLSGPAAGTVTRLLGLGWARTASVASLAAVLPPSAAWALHGVRSRADLWQAEARWWARVRRDAEALLAAPGFGLRSAVGAVALLAVDACQVRAALEVVARGGQGSEVLDALA